MKVCILSTGHDCMDDRLYYKEARSIAKRHPVVLIAPCLRGHAPSYSNLEYRPLSFRTGLRARIAALPKAFRMAKNAKPAIVHIHDYELILLVPLLKILVGARVVYDVWEANYEMMAESKRLPRVIALAIAVVFRAIERRLCRCCDLIVTADCQIAISYRDVAEVVVVKNYPIMSMLIPDASKLASLRKKYEGKRCVIYAGSMGEERGLFLMLPAIALVRQSVPNVKLLLVGSLDATQRAQVRAMIRTQGLHDNVDAVGWVPFEDVVNYISVAEIGLIPFLKTAKFAKNIPQKQFEYMACGVPVVGTDLMPIAHYLTRAGCGTLVGAPTPEEYAERITYLLGHEEERQVMSLRGRAAVANKWTWDHEEKLLLRAYKKLEEGSSRPRPQSCSTGTPQRGTEGGFP